MAVLLTSPSLHFSTTQLFSSPFPSSTLKPKTHLSFITFATADDDNTTTPESPSEPAAPDSNQDPFESRLSQVRLRYRSGTGKKAEARKSKKGISSSGSNPGSMYLPPVPLKEPMSEGLKVEFGFSPYSERVNGQIAALGLTALLLVELATGKSVINYHSPAIVLVQIYFVAAVAALYVKYEKEKVSVWPDSSPAKD